MCQDRWVRLRPALSLIAALTAVITALAPTASALPDRVAPIGHIGETLHFDYGTIGADVTVHNIEPTGVPAGMATPRGIIWKAYVTIRPTKVPNAYALLMALKLGGISPETGDAYEPQRTDEPDDLNYALRSAPRDQPSTARYTGTSTGARYVISCCARRRPRCTWPSGTCNPRHEQTNQQGWNR